MFDQIADGRTDLVFEYLAQGHSATAADPSGVSLIQWCAYYGDVSAMKFLLASGASIESLGDNFDLNAASFHGHWRLCKFLIERGADVNRALPDTGETPLHAALCTTNRLAHDLVLRVLLAHGANPNARLKTPALQRAHTPGEPTLAEGATPLMRAAKNGDAAAIGLLLASGADPAIRQKNGTMALMFAAGLGRGQGVFAKDYATEAELLESVKTLVEHGADVNAASERGETPLHFAAQASDDIVRYLAAHGAQLDAKDKQGRTPVDIALGKGLRGRAGGPVTVREETAALLRQLMAAQQTSSPAK